jgi:hypothetical protein
MADRVVTTITRWKTDNASITAAVNANKRIEQSLTFVEQREKEVAAAAARMEIAMSEAVRGRYLDRLADEAARGERGARSLARAFAEVGATDAEIDRVTRSIDRMTASADRASRSGGSNILNAADRFGTVGGQIFSGLGNSELANAAGLLGDVASAATTMNPALLGTVAAGGAVALVMGEVTRQFEASKKAAEDYAKRQMTLAELVASGATTADIQERIASVQAARAVLAEQATGLAALRDEVLQVIPNSASESAARTRQAIARATGGSDDPIFAAMNAIFKRASELTGQNIQDMNQLQLAVGALSGSTTEYVSQIYDLNTLLRSGALAYNDNKAAVDGFTETFKGNFREGFSEVGAGIKGFFDGWVAENERAAAAIAERQTNANTTLLDAITREVEAKDQLAKITLELNAIETQRVAALEALAAENAAKQAEFWRKAGEDVQAAEAKAQADREKQHEQHWKNIRDINRRAFAAQSNAQAARDVLAYYLSRQAQADELEREREANETRLKDIDAALKEQKDVIAARLKEQLATQDAAYRKQVDAANANARKLADVQRAAYQVQEVALQNAILAQNNLINAGNRTRENEELRHQTLVSSIVENGTRYIETTWLNLMNAMIAAMPGTGAGGGPGGGGGPLPTPYTPGVAGGGFTPAAAARSSSGGNVNVSFVVNGTSEEAVMREVRSAYREAARRMGA